MNFRLKMKPPTTTAQMHKVGVRNGKPYFYDPPEVKKAKADLMAHLSQFVPENPYDTAVMLSVAWRYPIQGTKHKDGEYRTQKPDTDNLQKLLKDCMTELQFWTDDALVVDESVTKKWVADRPGIQIGLISIEEFNRFVLDMTEDTDGADDNL